MAIDAARVEALYRQFGPAILRRCLRFLRDGAEAEDAMQEVFVNVCRSLDRFTYGQSPLPWVYQIAARVCLNRLRSGGRFQRATQVMTRSETAPVDLASALADRQLAASILSRFPERTALIAVHHLVDGMTQEEIAEALGLSRRTVYSHLTRFLAEAAKLVEETAS